MAKLAEAERRIAEVIENRDQLRALVVRLENEAHDGGILSETMGEVHRYATEERHGKRD